MPRRHLVVCVVVGWATGAGGAAAQSPETLTLADARARAERVSPSLLAARAAAEAARGRERQAGAFLNPALSYAREQVSDAGLSNTQDIAQLEQRIEIGGQRGARVAAARARREAAEARLQAVRADLHLEVARVFAEVIAADRRADLTAQASAQFGRATAVMNQRLAAGDVSMYAVRRLRLEWARYTALNAEARLVRQTARVRLARLLALPADSIASKLVLAARTDTLLMRPVDSIVQVALAHSPDAHAAELVLRAARADASLARRERLAPLLLSAGYKNENTIEDIDLEGFVAGVSIPVPLWDRRGGATQAANAETERVAAELNAVRIRITQETESALAAAGRADEQIALLSGQLGAEATAALRSAETAYAEGEITLVEWLDAVRAYQEAESAYALVLSESFTQRALLERLLGISLLQ